MIDPDAELYGNDNTQCHEVFDTETSTVSKGILAYFRRMTAKQSIQQGC